MHRQIILTVCLLLLSATEFVRADEHTPAFSAADRNYWAFQPLAHPAPPSSTNHPIDAFILAKQRERGLSQAPAANKRTLIRRVYFDLIGLPPTTAQVERFINDTSSDAYGKLIDQLLDSSHYGERWARHWLDLVRFAESDGFKADVFRPYAWRFRDYAIRSFNADKPFDRFIKEQLAGDELYPDDMDAQIATGYLRHSPDEDNQKDVQRQWRLNLDDCTEVTGEVFLGLGLRCTKCHDHKFDPLLQIDYYRLQAFFSAMLPVNSLVAAKDRSKAAAWEAETATIRSAMGTFEQPHLLKDRQALDKKFPIYLQHILAKPYDQRSPKEKQYTYLAMRQHRKTDAKTRVRMGKNKEWNALEEQLEIFEHNRPGATKLLAMRDVGSVAPSTTIGPESEQTVEPGFLSIIAPGDATVVAPTGGNTTGRRSALAQWIASPGNPLTSRVIVNRIWQWHFGKGIVATANDFGRQGTPPTHPLLLDWLAQRFIADGWSFKSMHRLILTSATYMQSPLHADTKKLTAIDPGNRYLWRADINRLSGDQIRDAMLCVSGELDKQADGPSQNGPTRCRSVFVKNIRNVPDKMLKSFDGPTTFDCCSQRYVSTTALQSLLLLNSKWSMDRAGAFAKRVQKLSGSDTARTVQAAYQIAYGRPANAAEVQRASTFLSMEIRAGRPPLDNQLLRGSESPAANGHDDVSPRLVDFCHSLLNSNEFIYLD